MWELDHKEGWAPKNWCFWTVVLEKTLECPLDNKQIKPINPKGNRPWIFIRRTDAEAPILWHLMRKADSLENTLMLGKTEDKRRTGWQRMRWTWVWANSRRQWRTGKAGMLQFIGCKQSHTTEWLNNSLQTWQIERAFVLSVVIL